MVLTLLELDMRLNRHQPEPLLAFLFESLTKFVLTYIVNHEGIIGHFGWLIGRHKLVFVPVILDWLTVMSDLFENEHGPLFFDLIGFLQVILVPLADELLLSGPLQVVLAHHLVHICIHLSGSQRRVLLCGLFHNVCRKRTDSVFSQGLVECREHVGSLVHLLGVDFHNFGLVGGADAVFALACKTQA